MKKIILIFTTLSVLASVLFYTSCTEPDIPQGYALVYGVSDYTGTANDLYYTDDDAVALADLLSSKGWNVTLGINEGASLSSITQDVNDISSQMSEEDRLLFYFSGHGLILDLDGGEPDSASNTYDEILALHGSLNTIFDFVQGDTGADVLSVTLSDDSLADLLSTLPSTNKTVIIDACFSGGFIGDGFTVSTISSDYTRGDITNIFTPTETIKMYLDYSPTDNDLPQDRFTILAASGETEESFELGNIGHGLFTYFLLKSPGYADYNFDGFISVIEAYRFAADGINSNFNDGTAYDYMPNIGAFPIDPVLFEAD